MKKNKTVKDKWVPLVCVVAPLLCFFLTKYSSLLVGAYVFDTEIILINGLLTFVGLWLISKPATGQTKF